MGGEMILSLILLALGLFVMWGGALEKDVFPRVALVLCGGALAIIGIVAIALTALQ